MSKKRFFLSLETNDYKRLVVITFFLFLLFCFLIAQFYKLQIMEGEKWTKHASFQHKCNVIEPFMRGRFFSNNTVSTRHLAEGQPFVVDVAKFHLLIDPKAIPLEEKDKIAEKICSFFNFSVKEKSKNIAQFYKESRSRKIVSWIDKDKKVEIERWWFSYIKQKKIPKNAVFFVQDYKRSYPFGSLLGQVLHTVQEDKDPDLQGIPTGGLELYFNSYLKGSIGVKEIVRSPTNTIGQRNIIQKAQDGADIYLTINQYIQAIVEEELERGVKKLNAKGAWAIMMDPQTGEILALGQYPFFDVNSYAKYFNDPDCVENTRVKAVIDAFEPGSIFKPISLAMFFKANKELAAKGKPPIFTPTEKVSTINGHFPGRTKPVQDGRLHHAMNMYMAIQKSSNVYMCQVIKRVIDKFGEEWYRKSLQDVFGFGLKTNIEYPGESSGMVPTPGKVHPNGTLEWSLSTPYSLATGHNVLVNSIQIVKAYSIIANGGFDVKPTLLRKIVKKDENDQEVLIYDENEERLKRGSKRVLDSESTQQIIKAMKYTTKIGGTSNGADIEGYTEAGKSGTSEKIIDGKYSDKLYISSFVGMAPAKNPRFVLLVVVDEPEKKYLPGIGKSWHGGICSGPIFSEIGKRTLEYLGVESDDPFGYSYKDPRSDRTKADWANEVNQLRKLYLQWNE